MNYLRQTGLVPVSKFRNRQVTLVGAGSVGSFTALTLAKMGLPKLTVYDEDRVDDHNIPNQFYRLKDVGKYKVKALSNILGSMTETVVIPFNVPYVNEPLKDTVIVATDSMFSRRLVWLEFLKQHQVRTFIEARMGAELGMVYTIRKPHDNPNLKPANRKFYEEMLYSDDEVPELPCTAKSIIYNVLMLSSLISRAYKSILMDEKFPRELVFSMHTMDERSYMYRK
jgi:molybdopterin/thiamine biosynthesis adenylyltransferase